MIFIDGDLNANKGDCEHYCIPTCHPSQTGPRWKYGCRNPKYYANKIDDFIPIVNCGGWLHKCEITKKYKME